MIDVVLSLLYFVILENYIFRLRSATMLNNRGIVVIL